MEQNPPSPLYRLLEIMARLRDRETGCPWDIEQSFETIAPCTIEEAYEVADAIERKDMASLREELGDLLLQVVFHAQMAQEKSLFNFDEVAQSLCDKLIFRHPHVFGEREAASAGEVLNIWEEMKTKEKEIRDMKSGAILPSVLDDIPLNLPALARAQKISKRAAKAGFEWSQTENVLDKVLEEVEEMREAIRSGDTRHMEEELGDVFFVFVNLGRKLGIDCEDAMRKANYKFERRFRGMENDIHQKNEEMKTLSADAWEAHWQAQKNMEKKTA